MSRLVELDPVLVNPLKRPDAPRARPAEKERTVRPVVMRTAAYIVAGAACLCLVGRVASFAMEPVVATYRTGQEINQLQVEMTRQQRVNNQLKEDIKYLHTTEGVEQEARRRGWVKPGEVALSVYSPDETGVSPTGTPSEKPQPKKVAIADQIRAAVDTCLSVLGGRPRGH